MPTLIKIDRSTIRKNPNAGRTEYQIPGAQHGTLNVRFACHPGKLQDKADAFTAMISESDCVVVRVKWQGAMIEIESVPSPGVDLDALARKIKDAIDRDPILAYRAIEAKWERQIQTFRTITPEPAFLFDTVPTDVECCDCHERFPHEELESDSAGWEDETWSDTVCPKCGAWDCCELDFEQLTPDMTAHLN